MIDNELDKESRIHLSMVADNVDRFLNNNVVNLNEISLSLMNTMAICSLAVAVERLIATIEKR